MDALARPVAIHLDRKHPSLSAYAVNGEFVRIGEISVHRSRSRLESLGDQTLSLRNDRFQNLSGSDFERSRHSDSGVVFQGEWFCPGFVDT